MIVVVNLCIDIVIHSQFECSSHLHAPSFVSLHLTKSSALELFLNVLTYISHSSYQEEHPKTNGGLVLVLINEMEKVLSVAGWCLASGVVSKEQYASIVEKIFSDKIADISDLVFCISDVAVTCVVEEDLTEKDELVFLKCQNLYEIIDVPSDSVFEVRSSVSYLLF